MKVLLIKLFIISFLFPLLLLSQESIAPQKNLSLKPTYGQINSLNFNKNPESLLTDEITFSYITHFAGVTGTPREITSQCIKGNNLFVGDWNDGVVRYDISNPNNPVLAQKYTQWKMIGYIAYVNNYFFLLESSTKIHIIDFTDINNPVEKFTYSTTSYLNEFVIKGNYLYLYANLHPRIEILNITDPINPIVESTLNLADGLTDIFISKESSYLYLTYMGGSDNYGFYIIDISNPKSPTLIKTVKTPYKPSAIQVNRNIAFISMWGNNNWYVYAYNISDPNNPTLLTNISGTGLSNEYPNIWEISILQDSVIVACLHNTNILQILLYDYNTNTFRLGPSLDLGSNVNPISTVSDIGTISGSLLKDNSITRQTKKITYYSYTHGGWAIISPSHGRFPSASSGIRVTKTEIPYQEITEKVTLTMAINPPEAGDGGCTITPSTGTHQYSKGEIVSLVANPNIYSGWNFKEWTGDVSGNSKNTSIVMNDNKIVVANFIKPTLTLEGLEYEWNICPVCDTRKYYIMLFSLSADDDDWYINSITFESDGDGDEYKHIKAVRLYMRDNLFGNILLDTKSYAADNGNITLDIKRKISSGDTKLFLVEYEFEDLIQIIDKLPTFYILTNSGYVSASPLNYPVGTKLPSATEIFSGGPIKLALVWNKNTKEGFIKTQDAISSNNTKNGDTISLCPTLESSFNVTKELTVTSEYGKSTVTVYGDVNINSNNVTIKNLSFQNLSGPLIIKIEGSEYKNLENIYLQNIDYLSRLELKVKNVKNILIEKFNKKSSLSYYTDKYFLPGFIQKTSTVSDSNLNIFAEYSHNTYINNNQVSYIKLFGVDTYVLDNNTLNNYTEDGMYLSLSDNGTISDNNLTGGKNGIHTYKSNNLTLTNNNFIGHSGYGLYIENAEKIDINTSRFTNNRYAMKIESSDSIHIENDTIMLNMYGIELSGVDNSTIRNNYLFKNMVQNLSAESSERNKVSNNIVMYGGALSFSYSNGKNEIKNNTLQNLNNNGLELTETSNNIITNNVIKDNQSGIFITSSHENLIEENIISGSKTEGTPSPDLTKFAGIVLQLSKNNTIHKNQINSNSYYGITLYKSPSNSVVRNVLKFNKFSGYNDGGGLNIMQSNDNTIINNYFYKNCKSISLDDSKNTIKGNTLIEGTCNTGIHLNNSYAEISENKISGDEGDAIIFENGSTGIVTNNSIFNNKGFGLNNKDVSITINASGNWWGNASGPSGIGSGTGDRITGKVNFSGWLTNPVSLKISVNNDTVYALKGHDDSTSIVVQNYLNSSDAIKIILSDSLGWLKEPKTTYAIIDDTTGKTLKIYFNVPSSTQINAVNKIKVQAISQNDTSAKDEKSFFIFCYQPQNSLIIISPDSVLMNQGRQIQFTAMGYDQHERILVFSPQWSATGGTIDNTGLFTSGKDSGDFVVTVKDQTTNVQSSARVLIRTGILKLTRIEIFPDSVILFPNQQKQFSAIGYDQFDSSYTFNPKWNTTGSRIDSNGLFSSGNDTGSFTITAKDSTLKVTATAKVWVTTNSLRLLSPSNQAINQSTTTTFNWYPYPDILSYEFQISKDSNFTNLIYNDSTFYSTSIIVRFLDNNTYYYWRIVAKTITNTILYSDKWKFKTIISSPQIVTLIFPKNQTSVKTDSILFIWYKSEPEIDRYWFELAKDSLFYQAQIDSTITDTTVKVKNISDKQTYWWKVKAHNITGWGSFSNVNKFSVTVVGIEDKNGIPVKFDISQNYPNPFNPSTSIRYQLPKSSNVKLIFYNILGQIVRVLVNEKQEPGYYQILWDGKNDNGSMVASGIYFYRLVVSGANPIVADDYIITKKLNLIK